MIQGKVGYATATGIFSSMERQTLYAMSVALNSTARDIREALRAEMPRVFDRPTPYTLNALTVRWATKDNLTAEVRFRDAAGKGIAADKYLGPEVFGGARGRKRSERALQRVGLPGDQYAFPAAGAELDAYGNMSRGQVVRLLSYLQAFGEQGYRANATARSRARTAKVSKASGYKTINGVQYFVSRGPGTWYGRPQHLPAGIWAKRGTHGADVTPVMIFGKAPAYQPRLDFYGVADEVFGERFDANFSTALDVALRTAR